MQPAKDQAVRNAAKDSAKRAARKAARDATPSGVPGAASNVTASATANAAPGAACTRVVHAREFRPQRAWDALELMQLDGVSARLHWTNAPYQWHVNDGSEVFAVIDGLVDMHYRCDGKERFVTLGPGDVFVACTGCEHIARPRGEAHVLVVERATSD